MRLHCRLRLVAITLGSTLLVACGDASAPEPDAAAYNIDASRISVSGLSSGAHMATQLHIAHSDLIKGAAILSGGPWNCAEGAIEKAIGPCLKGGDVDVEHLVTVAKAFEAAGKIDTLANLQDDTVWVFHGTLDNVVSSDMSAATTEFYAQLAGEVVFIDDVAAVHGLPTLASGAACDVFEAPFVNACEFDAAGEWLRAIYGELDERAEATGELATVAQPGAAGAGMLDEAYLYVPASCTTGEACGVHVAIHGCTQSSEFVGNAFAKGAGINEWAETNNLLVLYPQVAKSQLAPMNPYGCWDWWGYTNVDYATRSGRQITVIKATLDALAGTTF